MSTIPRLVTLLSGLAAVFVLLATALVASEYPSHEFGDWLFLLPLLAPLLTALMASALFFQRPRARLLYDCLWGVFAGLNLLLIHQALRLQLQTELLRRDATAYWGLLSVPAFYGWIAVVCLGLALGLGIGLVARHLPSPLAEQGDARERR
jgi:hypothetical protein